MCDCLEEIEELKAKVKHQAELSSYWMRLCDSKRGTINELRATLSNAEAKLSVVQHNLADTTKTLDKRDMYVKMSKANSELKARVKREADRADLWRSLWDLQQNTVSELQAELRNTKAELSVVRHNLADTTTTLDKYRDMHVKMRKANSELKKSVTGLNVALATIIEERDLASELFQGMIREYAKKCVDYDALATRYDSDHGKF